MKAIVRFTATLLFLAILLSSLISCKDNTVNELGISFELFEDMKKREVSYANLDYTNEDVEIFIIVYTREELDDPEGIDLYPEIRIEAYADYLIKALKYEVIDYVFDKERNSVYFTTVVESNSGLLVEYYAFLAMRSYDYLYLAGIECENSLRDIYEQPFKEWTDKITIENPEAYVPKDE